MSGHGLFAERDDQIPYFGVALEAPWTAVEIGEWWTWHAVTFERLCQSWPRAEGDFAPLVSACGIEGVKLLKLLWPPRVKGLPDGVTRCRACHRATGSRRPRSELRPEDDAA